jgi:hypothetical protein
LNLVLLLLQIDSSLNIDINYLAQLLKNNLLVDDAKFVSNKF